MTNVAPFYQKILPSERFSLEPKGLTERKQLHLGSQPWVDLFSSTAFDVNSLTIINLSRFKSLILTILQSLENLLSCIKRTWSVTNIIIIMNWYLCVYLSPTQGKVFISEWNIGVFPFRNYFLSKWRSL